MAKRLGLLLAALTLTMVGVPAVANATTTTPSMLIKANDLAEIQAAGGIMAPHWVAYGTGGPVSQLGIPVQTVTSYVSLENEFANGTLPGRYEWVLLDMEPWAWTPKNEYHDLPLYEKLSSELVHSHGMKIIVAPFIVGPKGLVDDVAGAAARYADAVGIQAQPMDNDTGTYKAFVDTAAAQARAANPDVLVGAGIATDSRGVPITGSQMFAAYKSVLPVVNWYWLNAAKWAHGSGCAPKGCPKVAIDFLHLLAG